MECQCQPIHERSHAACVLFMFRFLSFSSNLRKHANRTNHSDCRVRLCHFNSTQHSCIQRFRHSVHALGGVEGDDSNAMFVDFVEHLN